MTTSESTSPKTKWIFVLESGLYRKFRCAKYGHHIITANGEKPEDKMPECLWCPQVDKWQAEHPDDPKNKIPYEN